jgi:hypothetical protein
VNLVQTFQKIYTYIELFICIILRNFSRLCVYDWWISNGYKICFMDRKKFIKTSPEWHDLLDFICKDWQFDCPSGQHLEQHPSLISLVFRQVRATLYRHLTNNSMLLASKSNGQCLTIFSHTFYDWDDSIHCHVTSQLLANFGLRKSPPSVLGLIP